MQYDFTIKIIANLYFVHRNSIANSIQFGFWGSYIKFVMNLDTVDGLDGRGSLNEWNFAKHERADLQAFVVDKSQL